MLPPPLHKKTRRAVRLASWNVLLTVAGLILVGLAGEVWLRLTTPFVGRLFPLQFVPNVGVLGKPNAVVRWTDGRDFWTTSQTNSLGFLDRELISPERAAASCHIVMIGDSFVVAPEVAIADKFHVRLEALAARELPHLDVTSSAFGLRGTGQIAQLPLYDEYGRHLHPKLVVLLAVSNDFINNSTVLTSLETGQDVRHMYFSSAERDEMGKISIRPPSPNSLKSRYARGSGLPKSIALTIKEMWDNTREISFFLDLLYIQVRDVVYNWKLQLETRAAREPLSLHPSWFDRQWRPKGPLNIPLPRIPLILKRNLKDPRLVRQMSLLYFRDAVDMTAFALRQFQARANRDGTRIIILMTHTMRSEKGNKSFDLMNTLAKVRNIPIIDQYDYIIRQGGRVEDANWTHDLHWNPTGHRWAAEALLEYLKQHPEVCNGLPNDRLSLRAAG